MDRKALRIENPRKITIIHETNAQDEANRLNRLGIKTYFVPDASEATATEAIRDIKRMRKSAFVLVESEPGAWGEEFRKAVYSKARTFSLDMALIPNLKNYKIS